MAIKELKVLAVDDDAINLLLLKRMLKKSPNIKEVVEAGNGADAIAVLKTQRDIDVILLDIIMPVMGGIETLKVIRADDDLRQVPVIVLTTDETKKTEALECGANGFLVKPVREKDLVNKLAEIVV